MTECPPLTTVDKDAVAVNHDQVTQLLVSTYNRTVGTQVTLRCRLNLELNGPDTIMCMANGNWQQTPTCQVPTTTPNPLAKDNQPEIIIAMVAVVVVVLLIIAVLCIAIYHDRFKRKREKLGKENDQYNLDSVSSVEASRYPARPPGNVYNIFQNEAMRDADQRPPSDVNYYRSPEERGQPDRQFANNTNMYPRDNGDIRNYHVTRQPAADDNFHKYRQGGFYGYPNDYSNPGYLYGGPRRSSSLHNIPEEQRKTWMLDTTDDPTQRAFRRDGYLWRNNDPLSNMRIPRPRY